MTTPPLPCPFCGSTNTVESNSNGWPMILCNDCGSSGPCIHTERTQALEAWNRRAALAVPLPNPTQVERYTIPLYTAPIAAAQEALAPEGNAPLDYTGSNAPVNAPMAPPVAAASPLPQPPEPVARIYKGLIRWDFKGFEDGVRNLPEGEHLLYTRGTENDLTARPVPTPSPEGWKLVPIEPTDAMIDATYHGQPLSDIWHDMLAAAPQAPEPGES